MKVVKGDLIKMARSGHFDVIVHGCNCFCRMGAGIANSIKLAFPEAYLKDLETEEGGRTKLGTMSTAFVFRDGMNFAIVNGYTQFAYSGTSALVDYAAIRSVMIYVKNGFSGKRIGYPRIGAGLGGGDWGVISGIIDEALEGEDHTLVEYSEE